MYLWRAIDQNGEILDVLVQTRRNRRVGRTTALKDRTCTCGVESGGCRGFAPQDRHREFSLCTTPPTTRSTPADIFATLPITETVDKERSTSGTKPRWLPRKTDPKS